MPLRSRQFNAIPAIFSDFSLTDLLTAKTKLPETFVPGSD
jgi:hypothetical protein